MREAMLDAPVGEPTTNGHQASLQKSRNNAAGRTRRQTTAGYDSTVASFELTATVADQMAEVIAEVADGLVPARQRRGLTRRTDQHRHVRDNPLAF